MRYEFSDFYMLNKKDIEIGAEFNKKKFFEDIKERLSKEGFFVGRDYFFGNNEVIEGLCLCEDGEFWVVSYFERGTMFSPAFFVDSGDAALFLEAKLKRWRGKLN